MLEMKDVTKTFGSFKALDCLSLNVPKGAVYGLVGPNGAGKTTAIRHLTGVYRPDSGSVTLEGAPIDENLAAKERICCVADEPFYFPGASLEEMKNFYAGLYPKFDGKRFDELQDVFRLRRKAPLRRFSKGMQKQVAFWLALSCMPDYLILDEPVDGLDPVMRRQVWSLLMGDVADHGTTVLVSSHNLRELEDVCDHVGILSHGKVLLERSLTDLQDNVVKLQVAFPQPEPPQLPDDLNILHTSQIGRVFTYIVRGNPADIKARMAAYQPLLLEALPLSLEEIFIYELGGEDYAVRDIVL